MLKINVLTDLTIPDPKWCSTNDATCSTKNDENALGFMGGEFRHYTGRYGLSGGNL